MSATWDSKGVKVTPAGADEILIIDTEDSRNQKRATLSTISSLFWAKISDVVHLQVATDKLGLGVTAAKAKLHIRTTTVGAIEIPDADADELILENSGNIGYTVAPTVVIAPPATVSTADGTPVIIDGINKIFAFTPGVGYSIAPTLTFDAPGTGSDDATAIANMTGTAPNQTVASITITNKGSGYGIITPAVAVSGGSPSTPATVTSGPPGFISSVTASPIGSGYHSATPPNITIGTPALTNGTAAAATPNIVNTEVTSYNVTDGGSGFSTVPTFVVDAPPAAVTALATANISGGKVTTITIDTIGSGYKLPLPAVEISGGDGNGVGVDLITLNFTTSSVQSITVTKGGTGMTMFSPIDNVSVIDFAHPGNPRHGSFRFNHETGRFQIINTQRQALVIDNIGNVAVTATNVNHPDRFTVDSDITNAPVKIMIRDNFDRLKIGFDGTESFDITSNAAQVVVPTNSGDLNITTRGNFASDINFFTSAGTSLTQAAIITSSGRVGIGTTNPTQALDIADGRLSGNIVGIQGGWDIRNESDGVSIGTNFPSRLTFRTNNVRQVFVEPITGALGVGGFAPAIAKLAVISTTSGFLPPVLTTTQRDTISQPKIVANTTLAVVSNELIATTTTPNLFINLGIKVGSTVTVAGSTDLPNANAPHTVTFINSISWKAALTQSDGAATLAGTSSFNGVTPGLELYNTVQRAKNIHSGVEWRKVGFSGVTEFPIFSLADLPTPVLGIITALSNTIGGTNSGYTQAEAITLTNGSGTGATGTAVISAGGVIQSVTINDGGINFLDTDTLTITGVTSTTDTATIDVDTITNLITLTQSGNYNFKDSVAFGTNGLVFPEDVQITFTSSDPLFNVLSFSADSQSHLTVDKASHVLFLGVQIESSGNNSKMLDVTSKSAVSFTEQVVEVTDSEFRMTGTGGTAGTFNGTNVFSVSNSAMTGNVKGYTFTNCVATVFDRFGMEPTSASTDAQMIYTGTIFAANFDNGVFTLGSNGIAFDFDAGLNTGLAFSPSILIERVSVPLGDFYKPTSSGSFTSTVNLTTFNLLNETDDSGDALFTADAPPLDGIAENDIVENIAFPVGGYNGVFEAFNVTANTLKLRNPSTKVVLAHISPDTGNSQTHQTQFNTASTGILAVNDIATVTSTNYSDEKSLVRNVATTTFDLKVKTSFGVDDGGVTVDTIGGGGELLTVALTDPSLSEQWVNGKTVTLTSVTGSGATGTITATAGGLLQAITIVLQGTLYQVSQSLTINEPTGTWNSLEAPFTAAADVGESRAISSVTGVSPALAVFTTGTAWTNIEVGDIIVHTGFTAQPLSYNGTFVVIGTPSTTTYNVINAFTGDSVLGLGTDTGTAKISLTRFTSVNHGLAVNQGVKVSSSPSYEFAGTVRSKIDNAFDLKTAFIADEAGTWNVKSLIQKDSRLNVRNSTGSPSSMISGGWKSGANATGSTPNTTTYTDITFGTSSTVLPWINNERIKLINPITGEFEFIGNEIEEQVEVPLYYNAEATGANKNYLLSLHVDKTKSGTFVPMEDDFEFPMTFKNASETATVWRTATFSPGWRFKWKLKGDPDITAVTFTSSKVEMEAAI